MASNHIFISYRRKDSAYVTSSIYDKLSAHFGKEHIFTDVYSIPLGEDFAAYIDQQVGKCKVLLAIIGDQWVDIKDEEGNARLLNPRDYVRIEIESALKRKIPVIPILVDGARMPKVDQLPVSLKDLRMRNSTVIRPNPDFSADMDRLIQGLETILGSPESKQTDSRKGPDKPAGKGNKKALTLPLILGGIVLATLIVLGINIANKPKISEEGNALSTPETTGTSEAVSDQSSDTTKDNRENVVTSQKEAINNDLSESSNKPSDISGIVQHSGRDYKTIILADGKTWLAENMNYDIQGSSCYDGKIENCERYGRLYNWEAAKKACAALGNGWRLPTDEDWHTMSSAYGGYKNHQGAVDENMEPEKSFSALIASGKSGFDVLMGGVMFSKDRYSGIGLWAYFWSSTEKHRSSSAFRYHFTKGQMFRTASAKHTRQSCRCIKD